MEGGADIVVIVVVVVEERESVGRTVPFVGDNTLSPPHTNRHFSLSFSHSLTISTTWHPYRPHPPPPKRSSSHSTAHSSAHPRPSPHPLHPTAYMPRFSTARASLTIGRSLSTTKDWNDDPLLFLCHYETNIAWKDYRKNGHRI